MLLLWNFFIISTISFWTSWCLVELVACSLRLSARARVFLYLVPFVKLFYDVYAWDYGNHLALSGYFPQAAEEHTRFISVWASAIFPQFGITFHYLDGVRFSIADFFFGIFPTAMSLGVIALSSYFVWAFASKLYGILQEHWIIRSILQSARRIGGRIYQAKEYKGSPFVVGVFGPRVVVPADFFDRYAAKEREAILAHEEGHIKHMDSCINWFVVLADLVFAHVPMQWMKERISFYQECACDEQAVLCGVSKIVLSKTLLKSARSTFIQVPAFSRNSSLKGRIQAIAAVQRKGMWSFMLLLVAAYLGLGVFFAKLWTI